MVDAKSLGLIANRYVPVNHARAKPVGLLIRMLRPIIIRLRVSGVQPPVPTNAVFVALADITARMVS